MGKLQGQARGTVVEGRAPPPAWWMVDAFLFDGVAFGSRAESAFSNEHLTVT